MPSVAVCVAFGRLPFCQVLLEGIERQIPLRQEALEAGVLLFQFFEALGFGDAQAAVDLAPAVEGGFGDALLSAERLNGCLALFSLLQDSNDPLLAKLPLLHLAPP